MRIRRHAASAACVAGLVGALIGAWHQPPHIYGPSDVSTAGDEEVRPVADFRMTPWPLQYPMRDYLCWDRPNRATGGREMVYGLPHQMPDYGPAGYLHLTDLMPCLKAAGKLPEDYPLAVSGG